MVKILPAKTVHNNRTIDGPHGQLGRGVLFKDEGRLQLRGC